MKNPFAQRTTVDAIETEIKNLGKRRGEISTRISATKRGLEDARAQRRENLATGEDFDAQTKRIGELGNQLVDLQAVLADIDAQEADATDRLSTARDADARAESAAALEKVATAADGRAAEIEKAVATLAKAVAALKADFGDYTDLWPVQNPNRPEGSVDSANSHASTREVMAAIVAEALAKALPWMFDETLTPVGYRSSISRMMAPKAVWRNWASDQAATPLSVAEIISALVSVPLREMASNIKAGVAGSGKPAPKTASLEDRASELSANVMVFVTKSFSYYTDGTFLALVAEGWVRSVPEVIADVAEANDLAVRLSTPRGKLLFAEAKERSRGPRGSSTSIVSQSDCVPLGDIRNIISAPRDRIKKAAAS